ncbi:Gfo/Idh/MocA family oxidoreductase [Nesterenkonia sp. F]|uniref:Gfo/Idh/MocA family oxidoreductase n=1 Tax=Nesterenkonia sp. F TaxID=795955 RepID=UPI000255D1A0|nr:Gfo/Idh/MocA family oxidoreductase [Nesterenkonia sp. F]
MRIGLVGFGFGGRRFHLPYIQAAEDWELVGVVTRSASRRAELAEDAPGVPALDDLDALLARGVDVVVITTPPETRRELVLAALAGGAHVVADKPFAPTAEGGRELVAAAREAGRLLTVFHNRRWDTDVRTLAGVLASGELGTVRRAVNRFDVDEPDTLEAGPAHGLLRDLGSHQVDQMTHLFGPVARVDAHLDHIRIDGQDVDAGYVLGLHHHDGVFSQVSASKVFRLTERELTVHAEHGSYVSRMRDVQTEQILAGERPRTAAAWGVEDEERWGVLSTDAGRRAVPSAAGDYTDFYRELHAALAEGRAFSVTLEQAVHTLEVLDAARIADAEGRGVQL